MDSESEPRSTAPVLLLSVIIGVGSLAVALSSGSAISLNDTSGRILVRQGQIGAAGAAMELAIGLGIIIQKGYPGKISRSLVPFLFALLAGLSSVANLSGGYSNIRDYEKYRRASAFQNEGERLIYACRSFADVHLVEGWPKTLEDLSPQYMPREAIENAISGGGDMPGYEYMRPSKPVADDFIAIVSKTEVPYYHRFIVCFADGRIKLANKPFSPDLHDADFFRQP